MSEFTSEQIMTAMADALAEGKLDVFPGLLRLLAVQDPDLAAVILETVSLASAQQRAKEGQ